MATVACTKHPVEIVDGDYGFGIRMGLKHRRIAGVIHVVTDDIRNRLPLELQLGLRQHVGIAGDDIGCRSIDPFGWLWQIGSIALARNRIKLHAWLPGGMAHPVADGHDRENNQSGDLNDVMATLTASDPFTPRCAI